MTPFQKIGTWIFGLLAILILSTCSNPLGEKDKDTLIRTLIDNQLGRGIYLKYWDGKDKDKKTVTPGTYRCVLESEDYYQEIEMTAIEGSKGKPADSTGTGIGWYVDDSRIPLHYLLDPNFPDPFYAKDGTNIPFEVPKDTYIQLTIHIKK
jgi:hypothetical protein